MLESNTEVNKKCRIFLCYRSFGYEVAKNFKIFLDSSSQNYGKVWYSDFEQGNYKFDIRPLLESVRYVFLFLTSDFTEGFLTPEGKVNINNRQECITVQEIIEIERQRQARSIILYAVNINGYYFSDKDLEILEEVFRQADILREDTIDAFANINHKTYGRGTNWKHFFPELAQVIKPCSTYNNRMTVLDDKSLSGYDSCVTWEDVSAYYNGGPCSFKMVLSGRSVKRDMSNQIVDKIERHVQRIVAVLNAGGEGKTTILQQTAIELARKNYTVYYCNSGTSLELEDEVFAPNPVLIIDNANHVKNIFDILRVCLERDVPVVLAARANEWKALNCPNDEIRRSIFEIPFTGISQYEIECFAEALGPYSELEKDQIIDILKPLSNRNDDSFLLGCMLTIMNNGQPLVIICESILKRTFELPFATEIIERAKTLLALICLIEQAQQKMPTFLMRNLCKNYLDMPEIKLPVLIDNVLYRELQRTSEYIETRHPQISSCFLEILLRNYVDIASVINEFEYYERNMHRIEDRQPKYAVIYCNIFKSVLKYLYMYHKDAVYEADWCAYCTLEKMSKGINEKTTIANTWAKLKYESDPGGSIDTEYSWKWICNKAVFESAWHINSEGLYFWWVGVESIHNPGDIDTLYSARWLYNEGLKKSVSNLTALLIPWAALEEKEGNTGTVDQAYSARWIYHQGYLKSAPNLSALLIPWAALEEKEGNTGTVDQAYTARWIYHQGYLKTATNLPELLIPWAALEEREGNIGTVDQAYSARWIYHQGYLKSATNLSALLIPWAALEEREGNIGTVDQAYSARWIYHQGYLKTATNLSALLIPWAALEEKEGNTGTVDQAYSARWIYHQGYLKSAPNLSALLIPWAALEEREGNIGTVDQAHSARWIYYQGYLKSPTDLSALLIPWAALEEKEGNTGTVDQPYSARWIYHRGYLKSVPNLSALLIPWAALEEREGNIGTVDQPYSARWIYHRGYLKSSTDLSALLFQWAHLETGNGNIGNMSIKYTSKWILAQLMTQYEKKRYAKAAMTWMYLDHGFYARDEGILCLDLDDCILEYDKKLLHWKDNSITDLECVSVLLTDHNTRLTMILNPVHNSIFCGICKFFDTLEEAKLICDTLEASGMRWSEDNKVIIYTFKEWNVGDDSNAILSWIRINVKQLSKESA
ncbi:hypothetical protein ACOBQJ_04850 [Pelotomaculum propionicicum]|uniref:P-loop NTPase n=1 Tax=Pelotomaculum propionicicum TaxID=258475 RepID=UPI003B7CC789